MDYHHLNAKTLFDSQPMPRVDKLIEKVGGAKYISTIDLAKGYWQIRLDDDAMQKSALLPLLDVTGSELCHLEWFVLGPHL